MLFYTLQKKWLDFKIKHLAEEKKIFQQKTLLNQYRIHKKIETSKLVLWFMLLLLLSIVVFTGYVTIQMMTISATFGHGMDFTPLVALISAIVGQVIITLGYFTKSTKENSKDGIVYLNAQHQLNEEENDNIGGVG